MEKSNRELNEREKQLLLAFGRAARERMWDKRMKLIDLEQKSGVSRAVIIKIFKGGKYTIISLVRILVALDMDDLGRSMNT